jgi:hypothetical protein
MGTRLRNLLLSLLAAAAVIFAAPLSGASGVALAEPVCHNGTNWDNLAHSCR